jgi:hypothetical protein
MKMNKQDVLKFLLLGFSLYLLFAIFAKKEGFMNLQPKNISHTGTENLLLYGDYPVKNPPHLSNHNHNDFCENQIRGSKNLTTTNTMDWPTPDNGSCYPVSFCGGFYGKKSFPQKTPLPNPGFGNKGVRVNYYVSAPSACKDL